MSSGRRLAAILATVICLAIAATGVTLFIEWHDLSLWASLLLPAMIAIVALFLILFLLIRKPGKGTRS